MNEARSQRGILLEDEEVEHEAALADITPQSTPPSSPRIPNIPNSSDSDEDWSDTRSGQQSASPNKHGVATLLSDDLARRSKFIESNSDRILCQCIQFGGRSLLIINMYQFTTGNSPQAI